MLHRIIGVTALLLAGVSNVHAQRRAARTRTHPTLGWQVQTDSGGFDGPSTSLVVQSTDGHAALWVQCSADGPQVALVVDPPRFFDYYGTNYFVLVRARFLPDSTIEATSWTSMAASGHGNEIWAKVREVRDQPVTVAGGEIVEYGLLTKLQRADTLQAELNLYGQDRLVARFPMRNHEVLEHFRSTCPVPHQE